MKNSPIEQDAVMKITDFDNYDQALLWAGLKDGRHYAKVAVGQAGWWVTGVSWENPADTIDRSEHRHAKVVRLEDIEGLSDSGSDCGLHA